MSRLLLSQVQRLCQIETKANKYISNIIIIIVAYGIDYHYSLTPLLNQWLIYKNKTFQTPN